MDYLKQFLTNLTKDGTYYAEIVDTLAEIYIIEDDTPAILLEIQDNMYHINVRCDIPVNIVAKLIYDMTVLDEDIVVGQSFFVTDSGVLYGQNAMAAFFSTVYKTMDDIQLRKEMQLDDSIYVVQQPILAYGIRNERKNKMQRLWGTDK